MAEIAAIVVSRISPAIELGKVIVSPIKRQFNYLCCFTSNIQSLKDEAEKLKNERDGLQMRVDTANRNIEVIVPGVYEWLDASNQIQVKTSGIEVEIENVKRGCFAIKSRFSLSREAKKTAEAMKDLRESCNFEEMSLPAPPAIMAPILQRPSYEFYSRKQIEEEIMQDLRGRKVRMMGICGMGGVGKTTVAKQIMNRVRDENLFNEVVMVIVSQQVGMLKIQSEIAESLGMRLDEETLSARANKLCGRLMEARRILLILDDIWERLNLESLGIPCERCTVVLTSRSTNVLYTMEAQKVYELETLSETEAWFLFREKVGTCLDDSDMLSTAKEVAEECKGLPLALIIVGTTLKNEKSKHVWVDALHQLKSSNPTSMPDVLREVYKPVKLSYDFLDNPEARSLFLLCCLFPEDHDIHIEYLTLYGMGLCMFEGINDREQARNRVCTLLDTLKSCFLLLDGRDKNHVKMHDVVHDVAILIAFVEGRLDRKLSLTDSSREESINCTWISVLGEEINNLPIRMSFPRLGLLLIDNYSAKYEIRIDPCFFQRMEELNVLSFRSISFRSLPETTQLLKKLRTLYIEGCTSLETISIVGELLSLEILICRHCHKIAELPVEIGGLKRLKVLEVSDCSRLKRIAPGVISNLVQLEELEIVESFKKWETKRKGNERNNASLGELEHLSNLTKLEIDIWGATLATEEICLSPNIVKYQISLNKMVLQKRQGKGKSYSHEKSMHLELKKEITLGKWLHLFLRTTEYLYARGDGADNLDLAQSQNMKELIYRDCLTVNKLVNTTTSTGTFGVFPLLEYLELHQLPNLEDICKIPSLEYLGLDQLPNLEERCELPKASNSFGNLKELTLSECGKLRTLFPLAIAKDGLLQLEELRIDYCENMKEVFSNEKDGQQCHRITFPKLKRLELSFLPSLTAFCKGSESIEFPILNRILIGKCHKLTSLISCTWDHPYMEGHDDDGSYHLFCNHKVKFGCLKYITLEAQNNISNIWCRQIPVSFFNQLESLAIHYCDGIRNLFPSSIVENLVNLKSLSIRGNKEMVKVMEDDDEILCETPYLLFPSLKELTLLYLPKLQSFCNWRCDLQFPSLKIVAIYRCLLLGFFTMTSVSTPNLESITMDDEEKDVGDLNDTIQQHFRAKHKKGEIEEE